MKPPTPCIASTHWGDGLQAFWPSFHAWFAYPIPPKMQKMLKKDRKFLTFHLRRKLGRRYRARLGDGKLLHLVGLKLCKQDGSPTRPHFGARSLQKVHFCHWKKKVKVGGYYKVALWQRWTHGTGCGFFHGAYTGSFPAYLFFIQRAMADLQICV